MHTFTSECRYINFKVFVINTQLKNHSVYQYLVIEMSNDFLFSEIKFWSERLNKSGSEIYFILVDLDTDLIIYDDSNKSQTEQFQ